MITKDQIDAWLQARTESQRLEFKEAKAQFDLDKLNKYCVAIANEGGGHLILGVSDKFPREVVGSAAFPDVVEVSRKLSSARGFRIDVFEVDHPGGRVVAFSIPSRPRGTAYHHEGSYLMRAGASLVPMSEDRLRAIFAEGKPDWLEERSKSGLSAQEVVDLLDTQGFFELLGNSYPSNRDAVIDRLASERLIERDAASFGIKRLAAILLARRLSDFPDLARKAPRVVVYSGTGKLATKLDQTGSGGYATRFKDLVRFVMGQLPQNEVIADAIRTAVKLVPEDAMRELLANAIIHQDFEITGASMMVEIYADRVEISNPGLPIVEAERFIDGYQSRNERLAELMRRMGICEEKGSGVDRVVSAAEAYQLPAPDFRAEHQRTVTIVYGLKPFEQMDRDDRVRACYQHACLRQVMRQHMTNQSLRERFKLSEDKSAVVSQIIAAAVEAGKIKPDERVGTSRKLARYLPFWA